MPNRSVAASVFEYFKSQISDLRSFWWWLRQVSGDAAYERYLESRIRSGRAGCCVGGPKRILTRQEFYLDALERRYSGVSRCC